MSSVKMTVEGDNTGNYPDELSKQELLGLGHSKKSLTKIIRAKCLDCCCGQTGEVRHCLITDCSLWPYRMGTNPFRKKRVLSDSQKVALAQGRAA